MNFETAVRRRKIAACGLYNIGLDPFVVASRLCAFEAHRGTAFIKKRININALKLRENFSRLACHCDALVFLFGIRIRVRLAN